MSRQYILSCPPKLSRRIEKVGIGNAYKFYILNRTGPLSFQLGTDDQEGNEINPTPPKQFKVSLGETHYCSCLKSHVGLPCMHVLWILIKVFHLTPANPILFQRSLVERELQEILQGKISFDEKLRKEAAKLEDNHIQDLEELIKEVDAGLVTQRPIGPLDICAICQDSLEGGQTIYCRLSCGNSIHSKCAKILIQHQKSISKSLQDAGEEEIKCPLCRNCLGTVNSITKQIEAVNGDRNRKSKDESAHIHHGRECLECHSLPIKGNLFRCNSYQSTCPGLYLCQNCFNRGAHSQHAFEYRVKGHGKWVNAVRSVPATLPSSIISDFQNRELTAADYDTLLQLDSRQTQGSTPLHIIMTFPLIKVTSEAVKLKIRLEGSDGCCKICNQKIRMGEVVRRIPCGHGFHQICIDRWLLNRSNCPSCGVVAFHSLEGEGEDAFIAAEITYKESKSKMKKGKEKKNQQSEDQPPAFSLIISNSTTTFSHASLPPRMSLLPPLRPSPSAMRIRNTAITSTQHPLSLPLLAIAAESLFIGRGYGSGGGGGRERIEGSGERSTATRQLSRISSLDGRKSFGIPSSSPSSRSSSSFKPSFADLMIGGSNK